MSYSLHMRNCIITLYVERLISYSTGALIEDLRDSKVSTKLYTWLFTTTAGGEMSNCQI